MFSFLLLAPYAVQAETRIGSNDIKKDWVWDVSGSPYVLEDQLYLPKDHTLTVDAGVEIYSIERSDGEDPNTLTIEGVLNVNGTREKPVRFKNLGSLYFASSQSSISGSIFEETSLDFFSSTSTIKDSVIDGVFNAVTARGSSLDISGTVMSDVSYGISSYYIGPIFQARGNVVDVGGFGNAFEDISDMVLEPKQNRIRVQNSSFIDNHIYSIINQAVNPIDASNNWWGSNEDPIEKVRGPVSVTPWLDEDPNPPSCCSNVLFLPGIQASRLYKGSNMLWEPNRNEDVKKLFMDPLGKSIDSDITTRDIIGSAFGVKDIYASFIESMDELVARGSINEWKSIPYDWRKGAYDVVDSKMLDGVYALASTSRTGKVTIIAHSNGGLVAKALMKNLEDVGRGAIIDKSIFVAVPELGTPQAILSMLHGDNQSIAGGLVLSKETSRNFSQNLPGAYGLLPSEAFFRNNSLTVISDFFSRKNGVSISSYASMKDFLTKNFFSKASSTDIDTPLLLNSGLFGLAGKFHLFSDVWKPASTIKTLSIFGWGLPTSKSISYEKDVHCKQNDRFCPVTFSRAVTSSGDGTVLTASRSGLADETVFLNLKKIKDETGNGADHADILELPQLQNFLVDNITDAGSGDYKKYFSTTEPIDNDKWLYIKVHSPVDIHVYDENGNHTGLLENPADGVNSEDYENQIPSSVYDGWGRVKQVILPYNQEYKIFLDGTDTGTFTIETEVMQSDKVIASATFSEMPVTASMNADFVVATSTSSFASSTVMYIDVDGDGVSETLHNSDQVLKANRKDRKWFTKFRKKLNKHPSGFHRWR